MGLLTVTPTRARAVVITGASSGLGRAAAIRLSELGYLVFAGVRTTSSGASLTELRSSPGEVVPVVLDVTDTASIAQAGDFVEKECRGIGLWALVNNAGISISAPLECLPMQVLREQLETNVVGTAAVTQRFLPLLRASRGRIVNVTSGIGSIAPPYLGAYAAAQFAKEGLSDAMRRELRPLRVSVSVVQPGAVVTPIWAKMRRSADEILAAAPANVSEIYRQGFVGSLTTSERLVAGSRTTPGNYADAVAAALTARRPRIRYRVGVDSWGSALARRAIPDRMMDALIAVTPAILARVANPHCRKPSRAATIASEP